MAPFFAYAAAQLIKEPPLPHLFLDFQKANIYHIAWTFRLLLQTIVPPGEALEARLSCISNIIRWCGKPVDAVNFVQYAQPKNLKPDGVKYLLALFEHLTRYCRQLQKHLLDKERGIKTDFPQIKNLYELLAKL